MPECQIWSWRHETSYRINHTGNPRILDTSTWRCNVYFQEEANMQKWLAENVKGGYSFIPRYNSGNPMSALELTNEDDAMLFKLTFSQYFK